MVKVKKENTPYKELDHYEEKDLVTLCTCFSNRKDIEHPTDTVDGETCMYCGYFLIEKRISAAQASYFNRESTRKMVKESKKKLKKFIDKERFHQTKLH